MENILENLNKEQVEAVKTVSGPLLILAGAGSGKTKVLTTRIAYLIQNNFSKAREILAVTFTNKAAKEMKQRLGLILGENTVKYMWVGTFHGICGRILRENVENYFPNYKEIVKDGINKKAFNKYLEQKISDTEFIDLCFNRFVS